MRMNELRQLVARNSTVEEVQAIGAELKDSLGKTLPMTLFFNF